MGEAKYQSMHKLFFDFDEIDYYFNDYDENQLDKLYANRSKSDLDSFKMGLILGDVPKNIFDMDFLSKLEEIGFQKKIIDKNDYEEINNLFAEKFVEISFANSCIYIYRDILIFKKNKKIVGTAKICFSCMAHQITGTNANTENFGQAGDYEKLANILRKKK